MLIVLYGYAGLFWNPNGIDIKLIAALKIVKNASGQLEVYTSICVLHVTEKAHACLNIQFCYISPRQGSTKINEALSYKASKCPVNPVKTPVKTQAQP